MKMIDNEMNVTVPLEIIKASEIEPKEVKMAVVSVYSVWQGYSVAGRFRRWEKQVKCYQSPPCSQRENHFPLLMEKKPSL